MPNNVMADNADINKTTVSRTIRLWYPITETFATATYSLEIKAPEENNSVKVARNQSIVRTRAGRSIVYDRGNNLNSTLDLQFKDVTDVERSSLIVFLEAVQWASAKIVYQDMYGEIFYVRAIEENGITYVDQGVQNKQSGRASRILWNFELDLLDITDNMEELDEEDPPVSAALALHLADLDEPHNPTVCTTVNIADGAKVIESFLTLDWKSVTWLVVASKTTRKAVFLVTCTHNRDGVTSATLTAAPTLEFLNEIGTSIYSVLTVTSDVSGAGSAQIMRLKIASSEDGIQVCVKRIKI